MKTRIAILALALGWFAPPALAQPAAPPPEPPSEAAPAAPTAMPASAAAALDRANAAYEYGDMKEVVESARPIIDGAYQTDEAQRLQALRLLGIGLYLTGRPTGAENAFLELLRNRPKSRLDPTTTRPEVVAFFEDVRRRHRTNIEAAARDRSRKSMVWNFLPPVGQFKNGDTGRGFLFLSLEVAFGATALTSVLLLNKWCIDNNTCPGAPSTDTARTMKTVNYVSVGLLAATYAAGVIDAFTRADREPEESNVSFVIFPGGAGLAGKF